MNVSSARHSDEKHGVYAAAAAERFPAASVELALNFFSFSPQRKRERWKPVSTATPPTEPRRRFDVI